MSGGSYNYIYSRLSDECENRMYDAEMDDLIKDLCKVLHDLEWWQSCDSSEERYRKTLCTFKKKWFNGDREQRLKGYIDKQIGIVSRQLYAMIGEPTENENEVLDKIRSEIDGLTYYCETHPRTIIDDVLEIIDNYKAESEGAE